MAKISRVERTMKIIKAEVDLAVVVERWNPHVRRADGGRGIRQDLLGIIDILALTHFKPLRAIQVCGTDYQSHWVKIVQQKRLQAHLWLSSGATLEIWAWRKLKVKRGGKICRWEPRVVPVRIEDLGPMPSKENIDIFS